MNLEELVENADGKTVTAERLDSDIMRELGDDEQPHHLLSGESLVREDSSGTPDRLFPKMDETVSIVATDQRILLVVPTVSGTETVNLQYSTLNSVEIETGEFPTLHLEIGGNKVIANLTENEDPEPVAEFIERLENGWTPPT